MSRTTDILIRLASALDTEQVPESAALEVVILPCGGHGQGDGPHHHVIVQSDENRVLEVVTVPDGLPLTDSDIQHRIDVAASNVAARIKGRAAQPPVDERDANLAATLNPLGQRMTPGSWPPSSPIGPEQLAKMADALGIKIAVTEIAKAWQLDGERYVVGTHVQVGFKLPDEDGLTRTIAGELTDVDDVGITLAGSYFIAHRDITDAEAIEVKG